MFIIVGLGNPGRQYQKTRHNIGFIAIDLIIDCYNLNNKSSKFDADITTGTIDAHRVCTIKPQTYMNMSGSSVQAACAYYKTIPNEVLVIHDDIEIPSGVVKYKVGGGAGGHNGLKSIDQSIGANYHRIRIGVGKPENHNIDIADYVLSNFDNSQYHDALQNINIITDNIGLILSGKLDEFRQKLIYKPA